MTCQVTWKQARHLPYGQMCECGHSPLLHGDDGCGVCLVRAMVEEVRGAQS